MGISALFPPVHCVPLTTAFSQQLIHLPLVIIPDYLFVCRFLVSLRVQVSLRFPAPLSPQCSSGRTLRPIPL